MLQIYLRRRVLLALLDLLLLTLLLLRAYDGVAELGEGLYRRLRGRLLEDRRRRRDHDGAASRRYAEGDRDDARGCRRGLENVRSRFQLGRRRALRTLGVILEGDVMVRMLGFRYLPLAGGLEGNVTLWRKKLIVEKIAQQRKLTSRCEIPGLQNAYLSY